MARVNYQARWVTYGIWCRNHGHSISRPILKIADFLLYLLCSLHLSYSSFVSYCSMLSAVFRFVLVEVSSHPVLHDFLRSFRIERLLLSFKSSFLGFATGSFASLGVFPLNRLSLAPCGISHVRSSSSSLLPLLAEWVSFKLCLHQSPFRVTIFSYRIFPSSGPSPNLHPILFLGLFESSCLLDFVGNLPDELLLCPVRALWVYLHRTSSLPPRPCSLCFPSFSYSSSF